MTIAVLKDAVVIENSFFISVSSFTHVPLPCI